MPQINFTVVLLRKSWKPFTEKPRSGVSMTLHLTSKSLSYPDVSLAIPRTKQKFSFAFLLFFKPTKSITVVVHAYVRCESFELSLEIVHFKRLRRSKIRDVTRSRFQAIFSYEFLPQKRRKHEFFLTLLPAVQKIAHLSTVLWELLSWSLKNIFPLKRM